MGLSAVLDHGPVAVDASVVIYFIEEHPDYHPIVRPLFVEADAGALVLVTSSITLLEVLAVPLRAGATALANRYEALLTDGRGLHMVDVDRPAIPGLTIVQLSERAGTDVS